MRESQLGKRPVISVLMEYHSALASIDHVITNVTDRGSGCAWHTAVYPRSMLIRQEKSRMSPFLFTYRRVGSNAWLGNI